MHEHPKIISMKNCFAFILCLFLSLALLGKDTTSIKKETFLYAVKDKDSLFLDKYTPIKGYTDAS